MKISIIFFISIVYVNGNPRRRYGHDYSLYTTEVPNLTQEHTTTDSYTSSEIYTTNLDIPTGICEESENYISLNLSYTGLQKINERFINNSRVICLDLSNNNIHSISPGALKLLPNLIYLNLANNRIPLPELFLDIYNHQLKTLILDNNVRDENWSLSFQDFFPNVEYLYLRQNSLKSFSNANIFLNVRHLYLSDNNLLSTDDISSEVPLLKLTRLYLERNSINRFNGTIFSNVEILALDDNKIESLCNKYCKDSWLSLNRMSKLKHLSLKGNQINEVESDSFLETGNLISLDLSNNKITMIRKDTFKPLTMLEDLCLRGNRLTILPEFSYLTNIQNLNLGKNKFGNIFTGMFSDLYTLKNLSLDNNNISVVETYSFSNLISLEELDLSHNSIQNLPEKWMTPQNKLRILNLKDNYFVDFNELSLESAESLEHLFLERNAIAVLNPGSFIHLSNYVSIHLEDQSRRRLSYTKNARFGRFHNTFPWF